MTWVLGGVGVVAASSFVAFGLWGKSDENSVSASGCAPYCGDRMGSVRAKFIVADVSLGVAAVALGAAVVIALLPHNAAQASAAKAFSGDGTTLRW